MSPFIWMHPCWKTKGTLMILRFFLQILLTSTILNYSRLINMYICSSFTAAMNCLALFYSNRIFRVYRDIGRTQILCCIRRRYSTDRAPKYFDVIDNLNLLIWRVHEQTQDDLWPELLVASSIFPVVVTIPVVPAVVSLIVVVLVSCSHLALGVVVVIISWSSSLVIVPVRPVVFRWSCSFVMVSILSMCESICHFHELCYYFWFYLTHLFDEIFPTEPLCEGINCSLVRDVFS
jgi:hypothetical protein